MQPKYKMKDSHSPQKILQQQNQVNVYKSDLAKLASPERARQCMRFFKTGQGQYGEGDIFIGVSVPQIKKIAKKYYKTATIDELGILLQSPTHEDRLLSLTMLVVKFQKAQTDQEKQEIFTFYTAQQNIKHINNWDLVDASCYHIVGEYLLQSPKQTTILVSFAQSNHLWTKRIAMVSTLAFIRQSRFTEALHISQILLSDRHDLICKAVGWMLREIGKRNKDVMTSFLLQHASKMSSTTLGYATERLTKQEIESFRKLRVGRPT